jgi:hypothetical protein
VFDLVASDDQCVPGVARMRSLGIHGGPLLTRPAAAFEGRRRAHRKRPGLAKGLVREEHHDLGAKIDDGRRAFLPTREVVPDIRELGGSLREARLGSAFLSSVKDGQGSKTGRRAGPEARGDRRTGSARRRGLRRSAADQRGRP